MSRLDQIYIKDLVSTKEAPATFTAKQTVQEAASLFAKAGMKEIIVLDEANQVLGILTEKELIHGLLSENRANLVSEVMTKSFPTLFVTDTLSRALERFAGGDQILLILREDHSFFKTLEISDIRNVLQWELEWLTANLNDLPLNCLDPRGLLKILRGISEDSYIRICITDEKGILRFFNRAYEELTGIRREEAIGKHVKEIFPESRIPYILETGRPEIRYYRSEFEDRYIVSRRIPLKEGKEIIGALSFTLFRDISEMGDLLQRFNLVKNKMIYYKKELESIKSSKYTIEHIVGRSPQIVQMKEQIYKYAQGDSTVLITGESGTGKELVVHAIHQVSKRKHHPLIVVNCTSIPKDLLESELFGYEPGSFTGANQKGRLGKFELAHKGTIFLDEVGDMPLDLQAKVLRVLQEREIERIGGKMPIPVDFRLVAATNKNLDALVNEGRFREDLYYRVNVLTILVPPLKERKEDIPPLTQYILQRLNSKLERGVTCVDEEVYRIFAEYHWPGNVRELENVLEYAVNNAGSDTISPNSLPFFLTSFRKGSAFIPSGNRKISLQRAKDEFEKSFLIETLKKTKGNRLEAAKMLGTSRSGLYKLLNKFGINTLMNRLD
jgi:PAS domain S-box-containing protein